MSRAPAPIRTRLWVALAATAVTASACGATPTASDGSVAVVSTPAPAAGELQGAPLANPLIIEGLVADQVFSTSDGSETTLADLSQGHLLLVYFGYTHCPDICPTTLASLAIAFQQLPPDVVADVRVAFVTADPERDTSPVMADYLSHFDGGQDGVFLGLTAPLAETQAVGAALGVPLSDPVVDADGTVYVDHGAQVIGFVQGRADTLWLGSTSSATYVHDLAMLDGQLR